MSSALASVFSPTFNSLASARPPHPLCRAIVIVPARNEEVGLCSALDALRRQEDESGCPLSTDGYEVLLLLNNCDDRSAKVARQYQLRYPDFPMHVEECLLAPDIAHVGTARRMLMDLACTRLEKSRGNLPSRQSVILSTDADTVVANDWIVQNLAAIDAGADAVGGVIQLFAEDLAELDEGTRRAYHLDRELQGLVARLESLLDPDEADPWPRHLEHFGASLACTCAAYRRCGGLPPVKPLEDVAFVAALRSAGARIRHAPKVCIHTSARLDGRAEIGLAGQLRHWRRETSAGLPHLVDSAEWLAFRFATLARLRMQNARTEAADAGMFPEPARALVNRLLRLRLSTHEFLDRLDADALLEEMFRLQAAAPRYEEITEVIHKLKTTIRSLTAPERLDDACAPSRRCETALSARGGPASTPAG